MSFTTCWGLPCPEPPSLVLEDPELLELEARLVTEVLDPPAEAATAVDDRLLPDMGEPTPPVNDAALEAAEPVVPDPEPKEEPPPSRELVVPEE